MKNYLPILRGLFVFAVCVSQGGFAGGQGVTRDLDNLPFFKSYTNHRVSSYDRTGGNDDGNWENPIQPGETRALAEIEGPAIISHIWITIATPETMHLKKLVLRMYWDGETVRASKLRSETFSASDSESISSMTRRLCRWARKRR